MHVEDVIKRPLYLTEKGAKLREEENKYTFEVDLDANKVQIKDAVETLFKVTVDDVHTVGDARPHASHGPHVCQNPKLEKGDRHRS